MENDYSKRCIDCWNKSKCQQKYFMLAETKPVQGFVGCADIWCEKHKPDNNETESLGYYPESDNPLHCAECGRPLQCSLTDCGIEYVKNAIKNDSGCCQELWSALFKNYLA